MKLLSCGSIEEIYYGACAYYNSLTFISAIGITSLVATLTILCSYYYFKMKKSHIL